MEKVILIGGEAGQGSAVTSRLIGKIFCSLGYFVFDYRDYPSLIRGGHNFNVLKVSDKPIFSHSEKYDIIIALDQKTIDLHQDNLKEGGFILADTKIKGRKNISLDMGPILERLGGPKILENDILIGAFFKYFGVDLKLLSEEMEKEFGAKSDLIKKAVEEGWNLLETKEKLESGKRANYFISGNEAVAVGGLQAGMDVYLSYPMTPASNILHFLAKRQIENNILVIQPDDEIAAVLNATGAVFAGAKVMVGTSGGGFALMTETVSLAGMAELPLVIYLGQRTGPSTGVPTYNGQGDLKFALNAGHGEFPKIVVAPGDAQEAITRTEEAMYLSAKYRIPSIIIGDKHLGESGYSFSELKHSGLEHQRFISDNPGNNHKSYQITNNGVSPVAVPGQGPVVRATSYEHDEEGYTREDGQSIVKMNDKRLSKIKPIEKEIEKLNPVTLYGQGKNLIVGWGSTKGAIIDALPVLSDFRYLQVSYLNPFPKDAVKEEIEKADKVILVENNATGLLGDVIAEQIGILIKDKILKYDARPFTPEGLIKEIKKI